MKAEPTRVAKGQPLATENEQHRITVIGAGILGLWQALVLARAGHRVRLVDASAKPFADSASRLAGAMLAPGCESDGAPEIRGFGDQGLGYWRAIYPRLINAGSLIVAAPRDSAEAARFARATSPPETLDAGGVAALEPALAGRFGDSASTFPTKPTWPRRMRWPSCSIPRALPVRRSRLASSGQQRHPQPGIVIDCRGSPQETDCRSCAACAANACSSARTSCISPGPCACSTRAIRSTSCRGAMAASRRRNRAGKRGCRTDQRPLGARTARRGLCAAPCLRRSRDPGDRRGRPSRLPDNLPRAEIRDSGRQILVNGAYRHGFLLAPVLAHAVGRLPREPNAASPRPAFLRAWRATPIPTKVAPNDKHLRDAAPQSGTETSFGFRTVAENERQGLVNQVFSSVASAL